MLLCDQRLACPTSTAPFPTVFPPSFVSVDSVQMGYGDTPTRSRSATRLPNPPANRPPNRPTPQPSSLVPSVVPGPPSDRPIVPPLIPPVVYTPTRPKPKRDGSSPESSNQAGFSSGAKAPSQASIPPEDDSPGLAGARDSRVPIPNPVGSSAPVASAIAPQPSDATVSMMPPTATPSVTPTVGNTGTDSQASSLFTLPIVVGCLAIVAVSLAVVIAVMRRMRSAKSEQPSNTRSVDPAVPPTEVGNQHQLASSSPRPSMSAPTPDAAATSFGSTRMVTPPSTTHLPPPPLIPTVAPAPDSPPHSPTPLSRTTALGTAATTSATLRASLATTNRSRSDVGSVPGTQYSPTLYAQQLSPARRGSRDSTVSASSGTLYYSNSRAASTATVSPPDGSGGVLSDAMSSNVVSPPLPPMSPAATSPALWRLSMGSGFEQQQADAPAAPWPPLPRTVTLDLLDVPSAAASTAPLSPGDEVTGEELSTWVRSTFRTDFDTLEHGSIAGSIRGMRGLRDTMGGSDLSGSGSGMYGSDDDEDGGGGSILSVPGTPLTDAFSTDAGFPLARRAGPPLGLAVQAHSHTLAHSQPLSPLTLVEFASSEEEVSVHSASADAQMDQERVGRAA